MLERMERGRRWMLPSGLWTRTRSVAQPSLRFGLQPLSPHRLLPALVCTLCCRRPSFLARWRVWGRPAVRGPALAYTIAY